jgi:hypothetical protein
MCRSCSDCLFHISFSGPNREQSKILQYSVLPPIFTAATVAKAMCKYHGRSFRWYLNSLSQSHFELYVYFYFLIWVLFLPEISRYYMLWQWQWKETYRRRRTDISTYNICFWRLCLLHCSFKLNGKIKYLGLYKQETCWHKNETLKSMVFWIVTPCISKTGRCSRGTYRLYFQGWRVSQARNQQQQGARGAKRPLPQSL